MHDMACEFACAEGMHRNSQHELTKEGLPWVEGLYGGFTLLPCMIFSCQRHPEDMLTDESAEDGFCCII